MSTALDAPHPHSSSKASCEEPQVTTAKYELDGIEDDIEDDNSPTSLRSGYTRHDQKDMRRMGKQQELMRMFRALSTFSFTIIIQCTWEYVIIANYQGLKNGGLAGFFWSYIYVFCGYSMIVLSLAEMSSMAPTSGGQYHWVSEFAPAEYQRILSYVSGWLSTMSWQAGTASGAFVVGTIIQMLIALNQPSYLPEGWQGTLVVIGIALLVANINIWCVKALPFTQNVLFAVHAFGFTAIVIILWVVARVQSPKNVFTLFENNGQWSSMGLSLMVGQINSVYFMIGSDSAAHMAEEVKNAGLAVPRAIMASFLVNASMGFVMLVTILFCIPNVSDAVNNINFPGYPFLYVMRLSMSDEAVTGITGFLLVIVLAGNINCMASCSRQTFAFARDCGLPFHRWISHVHPRLHVPVNATVVTCMFTIILSLLNIGSTVAFSAIISLQMSSLMLTYMLSISCVLYRRLTHPELLPPARWSLGRFGIMINGAALIFSMFFLFWCFWPLQTSVDPTTFNWAILMFSTIVIASTIFYFLGGRRKYAGPVTLVTRV